MMLAQKRQKDQDVRDELMNTKKIGPKKKKKKERAIVPAAVDDFSTTDPKIMV